MSIVVDSLFLVSSSLPPGQTISLNLSDKEDMKQNPVTIKEGVGYNVGIKFKVNDDLVLGLRYSQVVRHSGVRVDQWERIMGSYRPSPDDEHYTFHFPTEESPTGMNGTYNVASRLIDDDNTVHADIEWSFRIAEDW